MDKKQAILAAKEYSNKIKNVFRLKRFSYSVLTQMEQLQMIATLTLQ
ncbi:hypothetical protein [Salicibibacter cibarius]|nr:hypothetical protein [Salicibibacter cibarius]